MRTTALSETDCVYAIGDGQLEPPETDRAQIPTDRNPITYPLADGRIAGERSLARQKMEGAPWLTVALSTLCGAKRFCQSSTAHEYPSQISTQNFLFM